MPKRVYASYRSNLYKRNVKRGRFTKSRRARRGKFMSRGSGDKVHQYVRNSGNTITAGTSVQTVPLGVALGNVGQGFVFTPALQDIVNYSELTTLYDQYKIWKVVFTFRLIQNPNSTAQVNNGSVTNSSNFYPNIWIVPDHDDSSTPTLPALREYARVKCFTLQPNRTIRYSTHPNVLGQLYDGAITTAYKVEKPGSVWVDCNQASVPHYGLKMYIDFMGLTNTQAYSVDVQAKYYVAMKCIR